MHSQDIDRRCRSHLRGNTSGRRTAPGVAKEHVVLIHHAGNVCGFHHGVGSSDDPVMRKENALRRCGVHVQLIARPAIDSHIGYKIRIGDGQALGRNTGLVGYVIYALHFLMVGTVKRDIDAAVDLHRGGRGLRDEALEGDGHRITAHPAARHSTHIDVRAVSDGRSVELTIPEAQFKGAAFHS